MYLHILMMMTVTDSLCVEGYKFFNNSCFGIHQTNLDFEAALEMCDRYHKEGMLASLHSKEELNFTTEMKLRSGVSEVWLGLTDRSKEKSWEWTDGSPWDYNVFPNQILQFGHIDDCARIAGKSVHDTRCHRKLPFMCRYKVNSSSLRKETTKKNTVLNSDDNKKNNNNNNVKEEENNDKIGTTTNKNMKEKNAGKQETNNIGDLKNSIKEAIGDIKTKSNNNVVNDVDIGSQSQSMLILIVGGAGIICLIVSTVFVCFWGSFRRSRSVCGHDPLQGSPPRWIRPGQSRRVSPELILQSQAGQSARSVSYQCSKVGQSPRENACDHERNCFPESSV